MATTDRAALGRIGEKLAQELLESHGLDIIECNWRHGRRGEIDIIADDLDEGCFVLIEVRTRVGRKRGTAFESVDPRKYARLRKLGAAWLSTQRQRRHIRIDVIAITVPSQYVDHALATGGLADIPVDIRWERAVSA
ncbi:MAG: choloylglycine hydrolase [Actinobacteria bacterium]|nr:MAG: choloylglycine hydrolase [Actinomycetota bacterium]